MEKELSKLNLKKSIQNKNIAEDNSKNQNLSCQLESTIIDDFNTCKTKQSQYQQEKQKKLAKALRTNIQRRKKIIS